MLLIRHLGRISLDNVEIAIALLHFDIKTYNMLSINMYVNKMSRITIEIPNSLHRAVKSYVGAKGETIKDFFVLAAEKHLKSESGIDLRSKQKESHISEEQADEILKPLIVKYIKQIQKGDFEGYEKDKFFSELDKESVYDRG